MGGLIRGIDRGERDLEEKGSGEGAINRDREEQSVLVGERVCYFCYQCDHCNNE